MSVTWLVLLCCSFALSSAQREANVAVTANSEESGSDLLSPSETDDHHLRAKRQAYNHNPQPYHTQYSRQYHPEPQRTQYHQSGGGPDGYGGNAYNENTGNAASSEYGSESGSAYGSQGGHESGDNGKAHQESSYDEPDGGYQAEDDSGDTDHDNDEGGHENTDDNGGHGHDDEDH